MCTGYSSTCWLLQDSIENSYNIKNRKTNQISSDLICANNKNENFDENADNDKDIDIIRNNNSSKHNNIDSNNNNIQIDEIGKNDDLAVEIVTILTSVLADLFFKLHLYCKVTQLKCLSALRSGKS